MLSQTIAFCVEYVLSVLHVSALPVTLQ